METDGAGRADSADEGERGVGLEGKCPSVQNDGVQLSGACGGRRSGAMRDISTRMPTERERQAYGM
jgi:hypothetical protein